MESLHAGRAHLGPVARPAYSGGFQLSRLSAARRAGHDGHDNDVWHLPQRDDAAAPELSPRRVDAWSIHGQFYGLWRILFPTVHPLLGGVTGLVGMLVWAAVGL